MGLSLEFLVGNKHEIVKGIAMENFDVIENIEKFGLVSDFSLHITPSDLDILFKIIGQKYGSGSISLKENLDTVDCFCDFPDRGAFHVKQKIKELIACIPISEESKIASSWYSALENLYQSEEIGDSSDAKNAIEDLIRICKVAINENKDLVYWWCG